MILAVTGHRPDKLGGYDVKQQALLDIARDYLLELKPEKVITGMALGWDQIVAQACVTWAIPFVAAVPCRTQASSWPEAAQEQYEHLLSCANEVVILAEEYTPECMQARNKWMVDNCDQVLALWNGSPGGTKNCIDYAQGKKPILNCWEKYKPRSNLGGNHKVITRWEDLPNLKNSSAIVCDTETSGVNPALADHPCGVVLGAMDSEDAYYVVLYNPDQFDECVPEQEFRDWWQGLQDKTLVFHNAKFDLKMLRRLGCECTGKIVDIMVAACVFDGSAFSYAMEKLTAKYLLGFVHQHYQAVQDWLSKNQPVKSTDEGDTPLNYSKMPLELISAYALEDCWVTRELMKIFQKQPVYEPIDNHGCESWGTRQLLQNEMELVKVIFEMEWKGVLIDRDRLCVLRDKAEGEIEGFKQHLIKLAGVTFEPSQWKRMSQAFEKAGGRVMFWTKRKDEKGKQKSDQYTEIKEESTGRPNWNGAAILNYLKRFKAEGNDPAFSFVLTYREVMSRERILSTFVYPILKFCDWCCVLHGEFNQTTVITGRLSSSHPNLQNIAKTGGSQDQKALEKFLGIKDDQVLSKLIRSLYIARPGKVLMSLDWGQVEYKVAVWIAQDQEMIQKWRDNPWLDYHQDTADLIGVDRDAAKTINFGRLYGMGLNSLAAMLTLTMGREYTYDEVKQICRILDNARPAMGRLIQEITRLAERQHYVQNCFGRTCTVPYGAEYVALNYWDQGQVGDMMRWKLVQIRKFIQENKFPVDPLITVHDEILVEYDEPLVCEYAPIFEKKMVECPFIGIPLTCDVELGYRWSDAVPHKCWLGEHDLVNGKCKKCKKLIIQGAA